MSYPGEKEIGSKIEKSKVLFAGLPGIGRVNGKRCVCDCPLVRVRKGSSNKTGAGLVQYRPNGASATSKNRFRSSTYVY